MLGDGTAGTFMDPSLADSSGGVVSPTGQFNLNALFLKSSLVVGESSGIPGLGGTDAAVSDSPLLSSVSPSWWDSIKNSASGVISKAESIEKSIYTEAKDVTKIVYGDVRDAAGTIYDDVSKPISGFISGTYWYAILAVVVLGGVIYFAGKSGALRVSR